ncbi:MAG: GNAT family protein [Armatimonadota bacterium]
MFTHKLTDDAELRLIEPRNAEELFLQIDRNRERLSQWMTFVDKAGSVDAERVFAKRGLHQFADGEGFHCDIMLKGKIVGGIGMMPVNVWNRSTELGYWLDADAEGKGLVTASCRALLDHCFNEMNINRVTLRTASGNTRSQAVAKRLGAVHESTQRQSAILQNKLVDIEVFSILKNEWPAGSPTGRAFFTYRLDDKTELGLLEPIHSKAVFDLVDRNREHLRRWFSWVDETQSEDDALATRKKQLHNFAKNGSMAAGIWHFGSLAGLIGFHTHNAKCMEIGYWLSEEHQGKGLAISSCKQLIRYAFEDLHINRIEIRAEPGNSRSWAIPRRLGFTYEGTLRQASVSSDGSMADMMVFSLLKDEWDTRLD